MVKPSNTASAQPEYQWRHRLTGALILAVVAALMFSWLLSRQDIQPGFDGNGNGNGNATATATGKKTFRSKLESSPLPLPLNAAEPVDKDNAAEQSEPAQAQEETTPALATPATGWMVWAGIFSEQANIDAVTAKLQKAGFETHQRPIKTSEGKDATGIWLGPYADEKTARAVSLKTLAVTGEKGYVTQYEP